jgi:hypothetical protein
LICDRGIIGIIGVVGIVGIISTVGIIGIIGTVGIIVIIGTVGIIDHAEGQGGPHYCSQRTVLVCTKERAWK